MQAVFPAAVLAAACADAKAYLRDGSALNDARIEPLAQAALALAEAFTGLALIAREHVETVPVGGAWVPLTAGPVGAITQVDGLPAEGAAFALSVGAFAIDIDARGVGWVRVLQPGIAGRVRVTFAAGMASEWAELPAPVRQGVVLLITHLADERSADSAPPAAVTALWRPWRRMRLAGAAAFRAAAGG